MIKSRVFKVAILTISLIVTSSSSSRATVIFYNDALAWQAAAGPNSFVEEFSGFAVDTQFRTSPVALNGMSIVQEGINASAFRNLIEVIPFQFADNNGTSHASTFVDGDQPTIVRVTFNNLTSAFGFQTWSAGDGEGLTVEVYNGLALLGSTTTSATAGFFTGFVAGGGDVATSVRFRSTTSDGSTAGEGFGLDNLRAVNGGTIPEPSTLSIFAMAFVGGLAAMRRR